MRQLTVPDNNLMDLLSDKFLLEESDEPQVILGKQLINRANEWLNQAVKSSLPITEISTAIDNVITDIRQQTNTQVVSVFHFDLKVIETLSSKFSTNVNLHNLAKNEITRYSQQMETLKQQLLPFSKKIDPNFVKQLTNIQSLVGQVSQGIHNCQDISVLTQTIFKTVEQFAPKEAAIGSVAAALFASVAKIASSNDKNMLQNALQPLSQSFSGLDQIGNFTGSNQAMMQQINMGGHAALKIIQGLSGGEGESAVLAITEGALGIASMIPVTAPYASIGLAAFSLCKALGVFGKPSSSGGTNPLLLYIRKEIAVFAEGINNRLDRIDAKIDVLYKIAIASLKELAEIKRDIKNIQYSIDKLRHEIDKFSAQVDRNLLDAAKKTFREHRELAIQTISPLTQEQTTNSLLYLHFWCTLEIKTVHVISGYKSPISSDADICKEVEKKGIDYTINILAKRAKFRDVDILPVANPTEFIHGARALIALIINTPHFSVSTGIVKALDQVIEVGQDIFNFRSFVKINLELFKNLCEDYWNSLYQLIIPILEDILLAEFNKINHRTFSSILLNSAFNLQEIQNKIRYKSDSPYPLLNSLYSQYYIAGREIYDANSFQSLEAINTTLAKWSAGTNEEQYNQVFKQLNVYRSDLGLSGLGLLEFMELQQIRINQSPLEAFTNIYSSIWKVITALIEAKNQNKFPNFEVTQEYLSSLNLDSYKDKLKSPEIEIRLSKIDTLRKLLIIYTAIGFRQEYKYNHELRQYLLGHLKTKSYFFEISTNNDDTKDTLVRDMLEGLFNKGSGVLLNKMIEEAETFKEEWLEKVASAKDNNNTEIQIDDPILATTLKELAAVRDMYLVKNSALLLPALPSVPPSSNYPKTMFLTACRQGKLEQIKEALQSGCGPKNALHEAVSFGQLDVVKLLMENGYSCLYKDKNGWNVIHYAAKKGELNIIKYFYNSEQNRPAFKEKTGNDLLSPLCLAINNCKFNIAQFLIKNGEGIDSVDKEGSTPLHLLIKFANDRRYIALGSGSKEAKDLVKLLVQIDDTLLDKKNAQGKTPKDIAETNVKKIISEVLKNTIIHKFIFTKFQTANTVHVAGSFNYWLHTKDGKIDLTNEATNIWQMQKDQTGKWVLEKPLQPGKYEYKFIIDGGKWFPANRPNKTCEVKAEIETPASTPKLEI